MLVSRGTTAVVESWRHSEEDAPPAAPATAIPEQGKQAPKKNVSSCCGKHHEGHRSTSARHEAR
jgi:hypothetical protein